MVEVSITRVQGMSRLGTAFANNRSRVAVVGGSVAEVLLLIACDYFKVPPELAVTLVGALAAKVTAYIVGNGINEAAALKVGLPAGGTIDSARIAPDPTADDVNTETTEPGTVR